LPADTYFVHTRGEIMLVATVGVQRQSSAYWVPMLGHAFKVLEAFYHAGVELSLQEVSTRTGVSKTSVLRILFTLGQLGYVERNKETGKYQVGFKIMETARRSLSRRNLVQIARPYMQQLHAKFDETINLAVLRHHEIIYVEIIESSQSFRMVTEVGSKVPMHATALGKAIGAFLPENEMRYIVNGSEMTRFTPRTIRTRDKFQRVVERVRQHGYAIDNEENEQNAFCIAAPILNGKEHSTAAISVAGPTHRVKPLQRTIVRQLKQVCAAITHTIQIVGLH
jgi:IclR family KDG regulon transcriptional repressor